MAPFFLLLKNQTRCLFRGVGMFCLFSFGLARWSYTVCIIHVTFGWSGSGHPLEEARPRQVQKAKFFSRKGSVCLAKSPSCGRLPLLSPAESYGLLFGVFDHQGDVSAGHVGSHCPAPSKPQSLSNLFEETLGIQLYKVAQTLISQPIAPLFGNTPASFLSCFYGDSPCSWRSFI